MSKNQRNKEITFNFVKAPGYQTSLVNGVFGGFSSRGQLSMNFFVDTVDLPKKITNIVLPNGVVGAEISREAGDKNIISREVIVGINIDFETAKTMYEWMGRHIDDFERNNTIKAIEETEEPVEVESKIGKHGNTGDK